MNATLGKTLLFALAPALLLLPFAGKPFHIDDPLFIAAARQILVDPARPFDTPVFWEETTKPLWDITANPPLVPYVLAAAFRLGGESERTAHLALLPFAMASCALAYRIARRFSSRPGGVTALFLLSPAFLVSAASVMSDVPALAFLLAALFVFSAPEPRSNGRSFLAGFLLGFAAVCKYQSIVVLPLFAAADVFTRPDRVAGIWRGWAIALAGFTLPFGAWALLGIVTHGTPHLLTTMSRGGAMFSDWKLLRRFASAATQSVVCTIAPLVIVPLAAALGKRWREAAVAMLVSTSAVGVLYFVARPRSIWFTGLSLVDSAWIALFVSVALLGMFLSRPDARSSQRAFPFMWVLAFEAYVVLSAYWVAARYLLPAVLPILILTVDLLDRLIGDDRRRRIVLAMSVLLTALWGAGTLLAENESAGFAKAAARDALARVPSGGRLFFNAHWGVQHYLEAGGAVPFEPGGEVPGPNDLVALSEQTFVVDVDAFRRRYERIAVIEAPRRVPIATIDRRVHAGFHSDILGILPLRLSTEPPDRIVLYRVRSDAS